MSVRFATVHRRVGTPPAWVAYITSDRRVFVWVPDLERFALNDALTDDLAWNQEFILRDISPQTAARYCKENQIGRIDPTMTWVLDELANADSLKGPEVLPAEPRTTPIEAARRLFQTLANRPDEPLVYKTYDASQRRAASRTASDLRAGRVVSFQQIMPTMRPVVDVVPTADHSRLMVIIHAEPLASGAEEADGTSTARQRQPRSSSTSVRMGRSGKPPRGGFVARGKVVYWSIDRPVVHSLVGKRVTTMAGDGKRHRVVVTEEMVGTKLRDHLRVTDCSSI